MIGGTQGLLLEKSLPGELGGKKRKGEKDLKKGPSVVCIDTSPPIVNFL